MKKVAVVLCGSGYKDGSEIREAVGVLWALSQEKVEIHCFAPDAPQVDVINCLNGEVVKGESRNMLTESARIARGEVKALSELDPAAFDALMIPGGFGAAKNLCDFAFKGSNAKVIPDLEKRILAFYQSHKPIGAVCIAPAIIALALRKEKLSITVGDKSETAQELEKLGHHLVSTPVTECFVDKEHKIVTTAAYMYGGAALHDIFNGIQKCVKEVIRLMK
jgi:enhancing lycopene biosynthesis protein 2